MCERHRNAGDFHSVEAQRAWSCKKWLVLCKIWMQVNSLKKCRQVGKSWLLRDQVLTRGKSLGFRGRKGLTDATNFTHVSDFQKSPTPTQKRKELP